MSESLESSQIIPHCKSLIKKIEGIVSARIVTGDDGKISEIHVVSKPDRNREQIVKDIESTLIAFIGSEIEHNKINIAQIDDESKRLFEPRLRIKRISTDKTPNNLEVKVLLADSKGEVFEGKASGGISLQSRMRTVACATIDAISTFIGDSTAFSFEEVHTFEIGNRQVISVLVSSLIDKKDECLLGSAIVKLDTYEATVAAVLNAVNRKIGVLSKK